MRTRRFLATGAAALAVMTFGLTGCGGGDGGGGGGEGTKDGVGADVRPVAAADAGGRGASSTDVDEIIQNAIEKVERSHVIDILKLTQNQLKTVPTLF